jgi:hypothetical protein
MRSLTQSSAASSLPAATFVSEKPITPYATSLNGSGPQNVPFGCQLTPAHRTLTRLRPVNYPLFDVQSNSLLLSSHTKHHITQAIQNGWADSTLRRYSGSIKQFLRFCDAERIPEHLRFPADEFVLCAFVASSFGKHAGGTPRSRLSALKAWHTTHNVKWNGSARLRFVLKGVRNCAPRTSRRPPRPPVNAKMLVQLVQSLDLNSPLDAAIAACASTAFWGQCRIGELLPLSSTPSSSSHPLPVRSDFKRSLKDTRSCVLRLPQTKTHYSGQDIVLVDQRYPINPISLLKNHIRVNGVHGNQPLFSISSPETTYSLLTKRIFLQRCNAIWSVFGYPHTTGHCFRIGGTTELLVLGTPPDVVKVTGRWSSDSFLRYWRSLEQIAPHYIRNIHSSRRRHMRT